MPLQCSSSAATFLALSLFIAITSYLQGLAVAQSCDALSGCLERQRSALSNLYSRVGGSNWTSNSKWTVDPWTADSGAIHCSWSGVYCCPGLACNYTRASAGCTNPCAVTVLNLANNNLVGRLDSAEIWEGLQSIQTLNLQGNSLTGPIPAGIANLPVLKAVSVQSNKLSGTIPPAMFQSANLAQIILAQNLLNGTIPDMSNLNRLQLMDLAGNQLEGSLPPFWASSPKLEYFSVQNNLLTGSVPTVKIPFKLRGSLVEINLRSNLLTGSLPVALAHLPIVRLDVSNNRFAGKLNQLLGTLSFLVSFSAERNMLSGTLPPTMASPGLQVFNMGNNQLTGTIPATWAKQGLMHTLGLSNNTGLTGVIPDSLVSWTTLETLAVENTRMRASKDNATGQLLPPFLYLTETFTTCDDIMNLACPLPGANASFFPNAQQILLDPAYFAYEGCVCLTGQKITAANSSVYCVADLVESHRNLSITLLVVVPALIVLLVLLDALGRLRQGSYEKYVKRWIKRRGAPGTGVDITLVSTDVEGSTELWEWDREVMDKAIDVHDHVVRTQLGQFNGYEVTTEGDAFLMAFHDASDAIAWTLATQQALLIAKWPAELQCHPKSCIRQMSQLQPSMRPARPPASAPASPPRKSQDGGQMRAADRDASLDVDRLALALQAYSDQQGGQDFLQLQDVIPSSVAFRGLTVRMGVATGRVSNTTTHPLTRRTVYHGPLVQLVEAIVGVAHGGQIITDSSTFSALSPNLNEVAQRVPARPDYDVMMARPRGHSRVWRGPFLSPMLADRTPRGVLGSPGLPIDFVTQPFGMSSTSQPAPQDQAAGASMAQRLSAKTPLVSATAGQLSGGAETKDPKSLESHSLMVMDMGQHVVQDLVQPLKLHQVMVPGLEDRAHAFPPLSTTQQLSPGYFDAPATREAPLGGAGSQGLKEELPLVTLVFSAVDGLKAMRAQGDVAAEHAMTLYRDVIRRLLRTTDGYECQEAEGNFMLAFHKPTKAVQFCLLVQEEMLKVHWREDVLSLPQCQAQVGGLGDRNQGLVFLGPRIKMGMYEGIPTRVAPHSTTGCTDYFGPFVNRAARFCNGAAHGGQVVGPSAIVPGLLQAWGCEKQPGDLSLGPEPQIPVPAATGVLAVASTTWGSRELQDLLKAKYPPMDPILPSGVSPQDSSAVPKEISRSAVAHPMLGDPADPQKLAASWMTNQLYGATAEQGAAAGSGLSSWALATQPKAHPLQDPLGPLYLHCKSSTWRASKTSSKPSFARQSHSSALISELGVAGSDNSTTALMTVAEAEEAEETKSDSTATAAKPLTQSSLQLHSSLMHMGSGLSEPGDTMDPVRRRTGSQLLQLTADRSSAVSVSSVAGSVRGNDRILEALSEVHISHIGNVKFKGLAEPQTVMQFSTAHLASRQFQSKPPSAKAELVEEGQGLQYVVVMRELPAPPPSRP